MIPVYHYIIRVGPARAVLDSLKHFCKSDPTEEAYGRQSENFAKGRRRGGGGGGGGGIDECQQTGMGYISPIHPYKWQT